MNDRAASTPADALHLLREGNARFVEDRRRTGRVDPERRSELAMTQQPFATVVGCSDSRVPFEHIFDVGIGDVFVVRNAGQVVDELTLGSLEFGTMVLGTPLLMVLRHTACGAVRAAVAGEPPVTLAVSKIMDAIAPAIELARSQSGTQTLQVDSPEDVEAVGRAHRDRTLRYIVDNSIAVMDRVANGTLVLVGAVYDLETGAVTFDTIIGNA